MHKNTPLQKIQLILLGLILTVIILELGLRIGGFVFKAVQEHYNVVSVRKKGVYRIVCIGEATTAYGGENAYPIHLEKILNNRNVGVTFSVINKGASGASTTSLVRDIKDHIKQYDPDMIISMMGVNDEYLADVPYGGANRSGIGKFFASFRTVKLANLIYNRFRPKTSLMKDVVTSAKEPKSVGWKNMMEGQSLPEIYDPVPSVFLKLIRIYDAKNDEKRRDMVYAKAMKREPSYYRLYLLFGRELRDARQYRKAAHIFHKVVSVKPEAFWAYYELGGCYRYLGDYDKSETMYKKAISIGPSNHWAYSGLALCYEEQKKKRQAKKCFNEAKKLQLTNYVPITRKKYNELVKIAKEKEIKLVSAQYPMRSVEPLKKILEDTIGSTYCG